MTIKVIPCTLVNTYSDSRPDSIRVVLEQGVLAHVPEPISLLRASGRSKRLPRHCFIIATWKCLLVGQRRRERRIWSALA
jgi:hypothetical protein